MLDSPLLPNLLYLLLVAGLWLAALAVVTPGSGVYELLALLALATVGAGTTVVEMNPWAWLPVGLGVVAFVISIWGSRQEIWLVVAALLLTLGSAFLFRQEGGGAGVNPLLALISTLGSVGFFWIVVRNVRKSQLAEPIFNPEHILGQLGEARTPIDPIGSAYVDGELWTVRADHPISAGTAVRVISREGLMLNVKPEGDNQGGN
ncbi:MAG: NfeD family protein [Anaerolineales bacterium]